MFLCFHFPTSIVCVCKWVLIWLWFRNCRPKRGCLVVSSPGRFSGEYRTIPAVQVGQHLKVAVKLIDKWTRVRNWGTYHKTRGQLAASPLAIIWNKFSHPGADTKYGLCPAGLTVWMWSSGWLWAILEVRFLKPLDSPISLRFSLHVLWAEEQGWSGSRYVAETL